MYEASIYAFGAAAIVINDLGEPSVTRLLALLTLIACAMAALSTRPVL